ncbi:MAG: leucine-rich repeat-containing protein kinase family protein [Campylobacterota bacterium]|nr:leucine-rich repeat-containing protein kinase family protein [Campylobacterota bacterium]
MKTHTLEELRSGKLKGIKELKMSEGLTSFPLEILELADSLELLDLSNNELSTIPNEIKKLTKLKIAFFSYNLFSDLPHAFKELDNLYMLGFKGNQIENFDEDILPLSISWLILTDNKLTKLPNSMGDLKKLCKFPIAGNRLRELPESMQKCQELELLRLSANNLQEIPIWLLKLPKLAWLAFSGNPCSISKAPNIKMIEHKDVEIDELLGEGASGKIYRARVKEFDKPVAIKMFKDSVTSDGYAQDEMNAYMSVGEHPSLIKVLARLESKHLGLVLEYISPRFKNLGNPPNFETCSRDTYDEAMLFKTEEIREVANAIISASTHLHEQGVMHGDLYAHNILVDGVYDTYLVDFGAASFYDKSNELYEKLEVLAFGNLLDDMLTRCPSNESELYKKLDFLRDSCRARDVSERPLFSEMSI